MTGGRIGRPHAAAEDRTVGRHAAGGERRRARHEAHPVVFGMAATMFAVAWLAVMLSIVWLMPVSVPTPHVRVVVTGVCIIAALSAPIPAWVVLARGKARRRL